MIRAAPRAWTVGGSATAVIAQDGAVRWVDHSVAPFKDGEGATTGFVSTPDRRDR